MEFNILLTYGNVTLSTGDFFPQTLPTVVFGISYQCLQSHVLLLFPSFHLSTHYRCCSSILFGVASHEDGKFDSPQPPAVP